jgi:hypothetical protein
MRNEDIEKLCNKTEEPITDITENEIQNKTEPKINITENEIQNKIEEIILPTIIDEPKTEVIEEVITEPNTETKIVKYIKEEVADISNNQLELLNDELIDEPTNIVKVVKNLADVKCIDKIYEPSIISSSRHSRPSFKQQIEQKLKEQIFNHHNKTIKFDYSDVVKIMNNKKTKTLKRFKE